ncbi:MAG: hypothetical protein QOH06_5612 [Acidobacteriota bacterium]|jgi:hypothetical protein|nr:hypothetical protein [Acidobacteriota bacterium]
MKSLRQVLVLILTVLASTSAGAQSEEASAADDPLVQDARQYAATYDVGLEEAVRRLRLQSAIGALASELATKERATFGGLWIRHEPSFLVVAQFTQKGGQNLESYLRAEAMAELAPAVERRTVRLPLRRLEAIQAAARRAARKQGLQADSQINVMENRVELFTTAPGEVIDAITAESRTSREAAALDLPANVRVIEVDHPSRPLEYVYGGPAVTDCTAGFTVVNGSGTLGISTAGHCPDVQAFNSRPLPYQAGEFFGAIDAQWHTAPDLIPTNRVFDGQSDATTPSYRFITSYKTRSQQVVGEFVCKYGVVTGYTCGTISSTTFAPDYIPGVTNTYVRIDNPNQEQGMPGDSGGPFFSGETAYGTMSGGVVGSGGSANGVFYAPVDALIALGVNVLTTNPDPALGRWSYRDIGNNVMHYTGINASDYECAVAGMAALDGDINEDDSGDIIQTYLFKEDNHWKIRGDFRAHNNQESWDFDLLCLKKASYPVSRFEWKNLGGNVNASTGLSTTTYDCGIAGMAGRDGDINENSAGDIIQTYMYKSGGTWWLRADFRSHNNNEEWDVDALCVQKWAPVSRYEFRNLGNNVSYNTNINASTYECGVAGMAARDGDIEEHNTGTILQSYLYKSGGTWWFRGDFRTHNNHESWDLDVLCIQR